MAHNRDHYKTAREMWRRAQRLENADDIIVTGKELDIATVFAVSRGGCQTYLTEDKETCAQIHASVRTLSDYLERGHAVYGVNTGFGGSADSRTKEMRKLQVALLQHVQSGVILDSDRNENGGPSEFFSEQTAMPISWVRAAMLVRCNSTARGHSAVTMDVVQSILRLLRNDIIPMVPLRGSVSASGDLMPLAFIAGAIEGNPDVLVRKRDGKRVSIQSAEAALAQHGIPKVIFGPKEALGLVNGTASSAALAALVMYNAHQVATLSQAFTAMAVEALIGNSESFHPFISAVRPHDGQIEVSRNILSLLKGSHFAKGMQGVKDRAPEGLVQDRYALRSVPQWIGPQLEDLLSAHDQVTTELNSSADNPIVDTTAQDIYYGANFQAAAITSAMEKSRLALQMLGKLFFAQSTELIDPTLNNGLPTNLCADDPSLSFTMKGVDVNMAAYMSELGYLANPVSSHVQSAEMANQSINSLALISARMTKKAVELVALMGATCLYVGCQALDLRALQYEFLGELQKALKIEQQSLLAPRLEQVELEKFEQQLQKQISATWKASSRLDIADRIKALGDAAVLCLMRVLEDSKPMPSESWSMNDIQSWRVRVESQATNIYRVVSHRFFQNPNTEAYLGIGSKALYRTIRHELGVPFHQGIPEHPGSDDNVIYGEQKRPRKIIGNWISIIYQAFLDGKISDALYNISDTDTNGHLNKGDLNNGHFSNGHLGNGHLSNGHLNNGHLNNGHLNNGHLNNGHLNNGHLNNGHLNNGHLNNGHLNNRDSVNGEPVKEHLAKGN